MKGYRFYADYGSPTFRRKGGDAPNAMAVLVENGSYNLGASNTRGYEAAVALTSDQDAPVCGSSVSLGYLRECCKRISESEAYRIHPNLKYYLAPASKVPPAARYHWQIEKKRKPK